MLVVDDDEGIRTLIEVTASLDARLEVVGSAHSGEDALAKLRARAGAVDLVLLDVSLPDVDGIELVASVRELASSAAIALFTGWSDDETRSRAVASGADAVIGKDGDPQQLLERLFRICAERSGA